MPVLLGWGFFVAAVPTSREIPAHLFFSLAGPGQRKVRTAPPKIPETLGDAHSRRSSEEGRIGLFSRPTAEKCIRRQNLGCGSRGERLRIGGLEVVLRPSPISEVKPFSPTFASQHSIMHSENKLCAITPRRD